MRNLERKNLRVTNERERESGEMCAVYNVRNLERNNLRVRNEEI